MSAEVDATGELLVAPKYRNGALPWGHQFALKTGWPDVDEKIAGEVVELGFPLDQDVTVRRTIEGGAEITERSSFRVRNFREVAFAAAGCSRAVRHGLRTPRRLGTGVGSASMVRDWRRKTEMPVPALRSTR